jgi:NAD(P)-dependent dehydrogenase (short-subunit alcohol dehydrogenase family)
MTLAGKTAIITGAGQGIGRAVAQVFAERGVRLVLTGRVASKLEAAREELRRPETSIELVPGDVGVRADVQRAVDTAVATFGRIDILVNNAQSLDRPADTDTAVLAITEENLAIPFRSGLLGTLYFMQAVHPHMKSAGGGVIINFGSATAVGGYPGFGAYAIAKEGIRGLSRVAANEWGPDNIRVNVILPAALTDGARRHLERDPAAYEAAVARVPLRRVGDPVQDIATAVAALADDDLAYLTGATLSLDGGSRLIN